MALVTNNISGSASNSSKIGITGSLIIASVPAIDFPSSPTDSKFFVSGTYGTQFSAKSVFGGDLVGSGSVKARFGFSGSLTNLYNGEPFLIGGSNITITSQSNGSITISAQGAGGGFEQTFDETDLVAGVLSVSHGIPSTDYVHVSVYDNDDKLIIPDEIEITGVGTLDVYLNSFRTDPGPSLPGTWHVFVSAGGAEPADPNTSIQFNDNGTFGGDVNFTFDKNNDRVHLTGSFSQGLQTNAAGNYSHAEGTDSVSSGYGSHAEGDSTTAIIDHSHAEGYLTFAAGNYSHAEGRQTKTLALGAHTEGYLTTGSANYSHAEGRETRIATTATAAHAEGFYTTVSGTYSHAEGQETIAEGTASHAEGDRAKSYGAHSHAEGRLTVASGSFSHAEGYLTNAEGEYSHAEGILTKAYGDVSHAEGRLTVASGSFSHAEGFNTISSGSHSHAEGYYTVSKGDYSHAEGYYTVTSGNYSHAEGNQTIARGVGSHAEGYQTLASGNYSFAAGYQTIASSQYQFVIGKENIADTNPNTLFVIGNSGFFSNIVTVNTASFILDQDDRPQVDLLPPGSDNQSAYPFLLRRWVFGFPSTSYTWGISAASLGSDVLAFGFGTATGTNETQLDTVCYIDSTVALSQLNFTGQHRSITSNSENFLNKIGQIVISVGTYAPLSGSELTVNDATPIVELSSTRNDKRCFGVISGAEDQESGKRSFELGNFVSVIKKQSKEDNRLFINSLGEGCVWVCNVNGNLENGDYITTCEIPGMGMKQDDDLLHNYTVAKITCDCNFDLNSDLYKCEEFTHEGKVYRRAFVGCTYHCG